MSKPVCFTYLFAYSINDKGLLARKTLVAKTCYEPQMTSENNVPRELERMEISLWLLVVKGGFREQVAFRFSFE